MKKRKCVKVLLSTYNGEKYLEEQLDSLRLQQNVEVSLAVRDDGSKDNSCEIINAFKQFFKIELFKEENVGVANSFMRLVHAVDTEADYYAFCDQDDFWVSNKLEKAVEQLEKENNNFPVLYYSNVERVGEELEKIENPFKKNYHTEELKGVLVSTAAAGCTMVFNRELLLLLKQYFPSYMIMHDAWTIQVCAAMNGKVIYDDNSYILYRQHSSNVVGGSEKMNYGSVRLFLYRVKKLFQWKSKNSLVAKELLNGYGNIMPKENKKIVEKYHKINSSIKNAIHILLFGVILQKDYTPYRLINFQFFLQVLFRKG